MCDSTDFKIFVALYEIFKANKLIMGSIFNQFCGLFTSILRHIRHSNFTASNSCQFFVNFTNLSQFYGL